MKKIILLFSCILMVLINLSGCGNRVSRGEREHMEYMRRKANYAQDLFFTMENRGGFPASIGAELRRNRENPEEESYVDVILVHSAEEAEGFSENILVVWPGEATYWNDSPIPGTLGRITYFNTIMHFNFPEVDLRDYGLSENKITLYDAVENWEIVDEIIGKYIR